MYIRQPKDTVWICSGCRRPDLDDAWRLQPIGIEGLCVRCGRTTPALHDQRAQALQLVESGYSPLTSTSEELVPYRPYVWDVNRYYADLGVPTDARLPELVRAFYVRDGENSRRLTVAMKCLGNRQRRAYYDSLQPPQLLFDCFVREAMEKRLRDQGRTDDLRYLDADRAIRVRDTSGGLDADEDLGKDVPPPQASYYLWQSNRRDGCALATWRAHLSGFLRQRGIHQIAVGWHGATDQPFEVVTPPAYSVPVFLLHQDEEPLEALAELAVSRATVA